MLVFVCLFLLGEGDVLDDSGRVRKGSRVWGLALCTREGSQKFAAS